MDRDFTPLEHFDLYADQPSRLRLGEVTEIKGQVDRAVRQLERGQAAHRTDQRRRIELGFREGKVPDELLVLGQHREDAMEFAIIAARRAVRAHHYMTTRRSVALPEFRQQEKIWALRDLLEHWVDWKVLEYRRSEIGFDERVLATKSAGKRWVEATRQEAYPSFGVSSWTAAPPPQVADPDSRITLWNGINIDQLTEDLLAFRAALEPMVEQAREWRTVDATEAIALVGPQVFALIPYFTNIRAMLDGDGAPRWDRADLLAADRKIREQFWMVDEKVLGPRTESNPDGLYDVPRGELPDGSSEHP